ncbi:hypothetical protein UlMin_013410 [Ulmus minor]
MDALYEEFPGSMSEFRFNHGSFSGWSSQNLVRDLNLNPDFLPADSADVPSESSPSPGSSSEGDSTENSPETGEASNATLKYITEMLMEEDLECKPCMLQDCLALQAAEKSLYDVIGQKYPASSDQIEENPDGKLVQSFFNIHGSNGVSSSRFSGLTGFDSFLSRVQPAEFPEEQSAEDSRERVGEFGFFLPSNPKLPFPSKELVSSPEENEKYSSIDSSKGKKNHEREIGDNPEEGRSNKQSAVYPDYSEPSEMFDRVLLCQNLLQRSDSCVVDLQENGKQRRNKSAKGSNSKRNRQKKQDSSRELVDLWTLLTQCAQSVASYDHKTANQLLIQIQQHSSPLGDDAQRVAHYFAHGLKVRLAAGTPSYNPLAGNGTSAADLLKAYQVYITACPFKKMSNSYANRTILKLAEKATRVHIIDFGILYGYQWPCLIQRLSIRKGGPPKLRITGIEFPQPGFRPSERVEETAQRLANYCKRFKVPFECNVIAKKWDAVQYEDLNIDRDELTVVNCLYRLKNLPDETVVEDCPRDRVLKLIRRINPDVFIHGVVNGNHNAPFFLTRFREALFHFSALFDMFEANVPREDQHRLLFEKEVYGRDIMNVIACEGSQRLERPETYKQWQVRNTRAGFRQIPLDRDLLKMVKRLVKSDYHKDFVLDEDGMWMLQGWKGRIFQAISCWQPV